MSNAFFERPILNSPYEYPARHWELGPDRQPTQRIIESRRRADFVMPIPAPKKRRVGERQEALLFDERSTQEQQYDHTAVINAMRADVDKWRAPPAPRTASFDAGSDVD
jgi:type III restriction enzyme